MKGRRYTEEQIMESPLVLADISGYTVFVSSTELEHSREILAELMETLCACGTGDLSVAQIEGDAVFWIGKTSGPELLDRLQNLFVEFHRRIRDMVALTICPCRACATVGSLTLKFVVHYGRYAHQQIVGTDHFVGSDVVIAHRLLKNTVPSREYVLATAPVLQRWSEGRRSFRPHTERLEEFGEVEAGYLDLRALREQARKEERTRVRPEEAHLRVSRRFPAPAATVWPLLVGELWLEHPVMRGADIAKVDVRHVTKVMSRQPTKGPQLGKEYHCWHGPGGQALTVFRVVGREELKALTTHVTGDRAGPGFYVTQELREEGPNRTRLDQFFWWHRRPGLAGLWESNWLPLLFRLAIRGEFRRLERMLADREKHGN